MRFDNIFQMVGNTPAVRIRMEEADKTKIYIKLEGCNPTGSLKDRPCIKSIEDAKEKGFLEKGMTILDASSGNYACSVAYFGKILGYPAKVIASSKLTRDKRDFIKYYDGELIQVGDYTFHGNQYCQNLVKNDRSGRYCFLDQLHNWANPQAHYESTAVEIYTEFPDADMVVGSLGTGATKFGVGAYLKSKNSNTKIIAVQAASGTKIPGTGAFDDGDYITPFIRKGIDDGLFDEMPKIDLKSAIRRTLQLREQGIYCGIQTGGLLHVTLNQIRQTNSKREVVLISGDAGWKNAEVLLRIFSEKEIASNNR